MSHDPLIAELETPIQAYARKYIIRVYSPDRAIQKTFSTRPILSEALAKGKQCGLPDVKLLLNEDGCQICDDEAFLHYIEKNAKFMAVSKISEWKPLKVLEPISIVSNKTSGL